MTLITLSIAAGTMLIMALVFTFILGWANRKFKVVEDPKIEEVLNVLPGVNCGGCGYLGCSDYAVAIVTDNDPVNKCTVGGKACAAGIAAIMGVEVGEMVKVFAVVHCGAHTGDRLKTHEYRGEARCSAAHQVAGLQGCAYGCIGFGDCVRACHYDAMHLEDGLATVDFNKCIGCGACSKVCPREIITITGFNEDRIPVVTCSNKDKAKDARNVCNTACIGCKACVKQSALFSVTDNLSRYDHAAFTPEQYEPAARAIEKCPTNCIRFIGKPLSEAPDSTGSV